MSYVGNTPTTQGFSPAIDYFSGTGSQTAFTCSRPIASNAQVQVVVNNVSQNPSTAFTVSGNTITFTGAPSSGTNNIYVYYTSPITQVIQPGQGTVGTTQLVDAAVTTAKLSSTTGTGAVALASLPTFTTTIGVGNATPSASGAGITFPTTQNPSSDANTLDDYEEGSWNPTITSDGTNPSLTYGSSSGQYVKIGRFVFVSWQLYMSTYTGGGSGNLNLSGLPFSANNSSAISIASTAYWSTAPQAGEINGTAVNLVKSLQNNTRSVVADLLTGSATAINYFRGSAVYWTTA